MLYDRKHFCSVLTNLSKLSHSRDHFCFIKIFLCNVLISKMFLQNTFQKCCPSQMFFRIGVLRNCPRSTRKSVLESLFNKATGLISCKFIKREAPTQVFSCEYHKMFENTFFTEHLRWLLLKIVEEFPGISNSTT